MTIAVLDLEVVHASTNLDAINTIAKISDAVITSALRENEGVTACTTPELVIALVAFKTVITRANARAEADRKAAEQRTKGFTLQPIRVTQYGGLRVD